MIDSHRKKHNGFAYNSLINYFPSQGSKAFQTKKFSTFVRYRKISTSGALEFEC